MPTNIKQLIEKLRTTSIKRVWDSVGRPYDYPEHLPQEAADAIEALADALQDLLDFPGGMYAPSLERKARAALAFTKATS